MTKRVDLERSELLDVLHPMQYGYRGDVLVLNPGDDTSITERYNRCIQCEEWSPCTQRQNFEKADRAWARHLTHRAAERSDG